MSSKKVFSNNKTSAPGKQECCYCHEKGHMIRECKILAAKEAKQKMFLKRPPTIEKKEPAKKIDIKIPVVSKFALLDSDDDESPETDEFVEKEINSKPDADFIAFYESMYKLRGLSWAEIDEMYPDE